MNWSYLSRELTENEISNNFGFVYLITFTDGKKYIGKKQLVKITNQKARIDGKKREGHVKFYNKIIKGKRTKFEKTSIESKFWKNYEGSAKYRENREIKSKEIIRLCKTEYDLTYWEYAYLFKEDALFTNDYLNQAIGRVFYPRDELTNSKKYVKEYDE